MKDGVFHIPDEISSKRYQQWENTLVAFFLDRHIPMHLVLKWTDKR
jgi:hypothetical protein